MNYLTNYYKNLSEQLQERINILEASIRSPGDLLRMGVEEKEKAINRASMGGLKSLSGDEILDIVRKHYMPFYDRAEKRKKLLNTALGQLPVAAAAGDIKTTMQIADVMSDTVQPSVGDKVAKPSDPDFKHPTYETLRQRRDSNIDTIHPSLRIAFSHTLPADTEAMRKIIQIFKGQYTPPLPPASVVSSRTPENAPHSSNATY